MTYLNKQLWNYAEAEGLLPKLREHERGNDLGPPVFAPQHADQNILLPPSAGAAVRAKVIGAVDKRHKWFRSMKSSQALTQSVFANLMVSGDLRVLNDLATDQGLLEHDAGHLGEKKASSIDVFIRGARRIAVECKLTEQKFGECSMVPKQCNGDYARQQGRKARCYLSERGILYWRHAPELFRWSSDRDLSPCPMRFPYQIARNLLAAYVAEDCTVNANSSHALIIYDKRSPAFAGGGKCREQFDAAYNALKNPSMLRSCSWQSVVALLAKNASTKWLATQLQNKYDF